MLRWVGVEINAEFEKYVDFRVSFLNVDWQQVWLACQYKIINKCQSSLLRN